MSLIAAARAAIGPERRSFAPVVDEDTEPPTPERTSNDDEEPRSMD